jgi:hypothetical protein
MNDYFQYDYVLHVNDYFQYDYIHVNDYFPKAVCGTSLQRLVTATTLYGYIEQGPSMIRMSNPRDNSAPVDSVNRPAFGYILNLLCVILLFKFYLSFNLNTCTCYALTGSLIIVMNLLIISGIKMYRKLPNCLTDGSPARPSTAMRIQQPAAAPFALDESLVLCCRLPMTCSR